MGASPEVLEPGEAGPWTLHQLGRALPTNTGKAAMVIGAETELGAQRYEAPLFSLSPRHTRSSLLGICRLRLPLVSHTLSSPAARTRTAETRRVGMVGPSVACAAVSHGCGR